MKRGWEPFPSVANLNRSLVRAAGGNEVEIDGIIDSGSPKIIDGLKVSSRVDSGALLILHRRW